MLDHLIDTYCAAWNEPDPTRRRAILATVWAEGATYTDPTVHNTGLDELVAHIDTVLTHRPGAKVVRTSKLDTHHNLVRFAWHVELPDGTTLPEGLDLAEITNNQIHRIIGFFGPLAVEDQHRPT